MYPSTLLSFILNFIHFSVSLASFADSLGLSYYAPVVESSEVTHLVRKDPTHGNIDWNFLAPRDLWSRDDTGTCSDSTPCSNGACCSNSGYCGYSPDFCGTGNCTSNCDAKAECGEYAVEGSQDCPLNVCCSQYGYVFTVYTYVCASQLTIQQDSVERLLTCESIPMFDKRAIESCLYRIARIRQTRRKSTQTNIRKRDNLKISIVTTRSATDDPIL